MQYYQIFGLAVASEIALPGATAQAADAAEVFIRLQPVPERLEEALEQGPNWAWAPGLFLLQIPGIARFLLREGREVLVEVEGETSVEDIAIFLTGTVLGILLHQRDQIVLHASAVLVGQRAVLFCGSSGMGKSTMAAALNQRGYPVIADDVAAMGLDQPGAPVIMPDGRNLKLWRDTSDYLALNRGLAVRRGLQKHYVAPLSVRSDKVPLGAIYILREARPPHVSGIAPTNIVDATVLLRRNAYRPALVSRMNQTARYFDAAARSAAHAGMFYLTRGLDFAAMDGVIAELENHWAEIGLARAA